MTRTRITVDVDPEVRRRIRLADRDETIKDFVERAILHELGQTEEQGYYPAEGAKPTGLEDAPRPKSGRTVAEAVVEDRR